MNWKNLECGDNHNVDLPYSINNYLIILPLKIYVEVISTLIPCVEIFLLSKMIEKNQTMLALSWFRKLLILLYSIVHIQFLPLSSCSLSSTPSSFQTVLSDAINPRIIAGSVPLMVRDSPYKIVEAKHGLFLIHKGDMYIGNSLDVYGGKILNNHYIMFIACRFTIFFVLNSGKLMLFYDIHNNEIEWSDREIDYFVQIIKINDTVLDIGGNIRIWNMMILIYKPYILI